MAKIHHRNTCRFCESSKVELVVPLSPVPLAEKYVTQDRLQQADERFPIDLYMCGDCGLVQLLDVVDPELLWGDFTFRSGQARRIVEHLTQCADQACHRFKPPAGSLVVDVGSNDGTLLKGFQTNGMRVLGIDPAREIAQKATEAGVETLNAFLTIDLARRIRAERGPAAVVTCFNAFAHADDMAGMAESIREMLAPNGIFVFETSYLLDILDHTLLGTIFHEHLCHHSVKPMRQFLKRHGLELIDVERNALQGGSFVGTAQRIGGPHPVSASVGKLLDLEKRRGLDRPETFKGFSTRLKGLRSEMGELLAAWKQRGAVVAGYGAARSGPTLIAELGLSGAIRFVVDDHPQKVHKFTPGDHIPVLPTSELYTRKPDYVIILAWVHADKIIAENHEYLEQGGNFVLCCPEVDVIGAESVRMMS
jgi:2-polyprenyl-3-methyl-5-hydroxy-6-metoxy-1,4-benzoquinol methylase